MKKNLILGLATLGLVVAMTSCSSVPQEKIDAANVAVDSAKIEGADLYLPEAFTALQDSLNVALQTVEEQKSKLFGSSAEAKAKLEAVVTLAGQVKEQTAAKKVEIKAAVETMIGEINQLILDNKALVASAPKGKEGTAALEAIKGEIAVLETSVTETAGLLESGDLLGAQNKSTATKMKAESIKAELTEVIAKYKAAAKRK
ncbi:MAG: hypothetical protein ACOYXB_01275 [Bacteroidota bacterium]